MLGADGLAVCFRECRAEEAGGCAFGLAAAAAATPGNTGPVGSGFMMLTAGIDAAVGKSMFTNLLCMPAEFGGAVALAGAVAPSATGASGVAAHSAA
jgi:hypothetical protein